MEERALANVDQDYATADGPLVVQAWKADDTGVDPLGLRQVNLDMMDALLPGINNVTRHVRVYTLMTWAWWKAGQLISGGGQHGASLNRMRDYVDRVDAVFSWSQFDLVPTATLPGSTVLPQNLNRSGPIAYDFSQPDWEKLRKSRRNSTDLLAAIQYGPSIRGAGGLHWLVESEGAFAPSTEVLPAVEAFDAAVAPHLPLCLRDPASTTLALDELAQIGPVWDHRNPLAAERTAFINQFSGAYEPNNRNTRQASRRATLNLMMHALTGAGASSTVEKVRARMFGIEADVLPDGPLLKARHAWRVLQLRQLQRLAIEALYLSIETRLRAESLPIAGILEFLADSLEVDGIDVEASTDAMLDQAFAPWVADPNGAVFQLMAELEQRQRSDPATIPRFSLAALRCVHLLAGAERDHQTGADFLRAFEREADRLPLGLFINRMDALGPRPAEGPSGDRRGLDIRAAPALVHHSER